LRPENHAGIYQQKGIPGRIDARDKENEVGKEHEAAGRQGKFWEFHDELFKSHNQLDEEKFQQIADGIKLNKDQFEKDRQDPLLLEIVKHDFNQGIEAGVNSVPTVFVNGRRLKQRSLDGFQKFIDKELKNIKISSP
jgi:protein-disulfide isomerase